MAAMGGALAGMSSLFTEILPIYTFVSPHYGKAEIIEIYISKKLFWKFTYHLMHSASAVLKRSQKQEDSPHGTRPIGRPAMVQTLSPRFSSVVSFHKLVGILSSLGTLIKHVLTSCLFPSSFVTGSSTHGGGRI